MAFSPMLFKTPEKAKKGRSSHKKKAVGVCMFVYKASKYRKEEVTIEIFTRCSKMVRLCYFNSHFGGPINVTRKIYLVNKQHRDTKKHILKIKLTWEKSSSLPTSEYEVSFGLPEKKRLEINPKIFRL